MKQKAPSATMTVDEAHTLLGKDKISRGAFYQALARNQVPHLRLSQRRILIPRRAFEAWLDSAGQGSQQAKG